MKIAVNGKIKEIETPTEIVFVPIDIQIEELKKKLDDTDYIACKLAEGVATVEEYSDIIKQRQQWRKEINELEAILKAKEEEEMR